MFLPFSVQMNCSSYLRKIAFISRANFSRFFTPTVLIDNIRILHSDLLLNCIKSRLSWRCTYLCTSKFLSLINLLESLGYKLARMSCCIGWFYIYLERTLAEEKRIQRQLGANFKLKLLIIVINGRFFSNFVVFSQYMNYISWAF